MSKVLFDWTTGIQEAIDHAYDSTHETLVTLLSSHEADNTAEFADTRSSLLGSLAQHNNENNQDFATRTSTLTMHSVQDDITFSEYELRARNCLTTLETEKIEGRLYFDQLLGDHEAAADPHPGKYVLTSSIGSSVPPLVNGAVPFSYLPSDVILLDTLQTTYTGTALAQWSVSSTTDKDQITRALSKDTDTLFVERDTGFAYCFIGKDHILMPLKVVTDTDLAGASPVNAAANKAVSTALTKLQPAHALLTNFSEGLSIGRGFVASRGGGSFGPVSLQAGAGLRVVNMDSPDPTMIYIKTATTNVAVDSVTSSSHPGSLDIPARSDHTHKMVNHTHTWSQIEDAEIGVRNTVTSLSSYSTSLSYTPSGSESLRNVLGNLNAMSLRVSSTTGQTNADVVALNGNMNTLHSKYYSLWYTLGGNTGFSASSVLATSASGQIATYSAVDGTHLNYAAYLSANVAGQLGVRAAKMSHAVLSASTVQWNCSAEPTWYHFYSAGVHISATQTYVCLSDIMYATSHLIYRVTRGKDCGIVLQANSSDAKYKAHWYLGTYRCEANEIFLLGATSVLFVKTVNTLNQVTVFIQCT